MTIDGGHFEQVVAILDGQPFIEVADRRQSLGQHGANHPGNVDVLD